MKITCHTLFDVTRTGVNFRNRFDTKTDLELNRQRNQQSNFETILQVVSMRGQPENISRCVEQKIDVGDLEKYNFGYLFSKKYLKKVKTVSIWSFSFEINGTSIFNDGITELGNLLKDCDHVPMIINLNESVKLSNHLDITDESRNIQFTVDKNYEEES